MYKDVVDGRLCMTYKCLIVSKDIRDTLHNQQYLKFWCPLSAV